MPPTFPPFAVRPGEAEVERVIYASLASNQDGIYATMEAIREQALRHNPAVDVHAALLYQSGWFLYWAEGPGTAIRELLVRVQRDRRHHSHHVVHHSRGRRLLLTDWSMMLSSSTESAARFGGRVMTLWAEMKAGRQFAPNSVVRRLTAPMLLPTARGLPDPESFNRVGVCSAAGTGAFDLVRWMAEMHRVPVEQRRFAGEADRDSGSEFVDFMHGGFPCRVVAVARSDLAHGLRRALVLDWQLLLLLFCGEPKRDAALRSRVTQMLHGLPCTPELLAVSPDATSRAHLDAAAPGTHDLTWLPDGLVPEYNAAGLWHALAARLDQLEDPPGSVWPLIEPSPG